MVVVGVAAVVVICDDRGVGEDKYLLRTRGRGESDDLVSGERRLFVTVVESPLRIFTTVGSFVNCRGKGFVFDIPLSIPVKSLYSDIDTVGSDGDSEMTRAAELPVSYTGLTMLGV